MNHPGQIRAGYTPVVYCQTFPRLICLTETFETLNQHIKKETTGAQKALQKSYIKKCKIWQNVFVWMQLFCAVLMQSFDETFFRKKLYQKSF